MGELKVIGKSPTVMVGDEIKGEVYLTWRTENSEETTFAETVFQEYINKGWLAIGESKGEKQQIFTFNPELEKIVLTPLVVGG